MGVGIYKGLQVGEKVLKHILWLQFLGKSFHLEKLIVSLSP